MNATFLTMAATAILTAHASDPKFVTSEPNGGWSEGGYYVHNNMWNSSKYTPCVQTLTAWSHDRWHVVARMNNSTRDGAVKTYPNVHKDYPSVPISSFYALTSAFAEKSPHVGIYNVAYDIWINGTATPNSTEIMIWTENCNQVPAGKNVEDATLSGHAFKVYRTSNGRYLAFVAKPNFTTGKLNLLDLMRWAAAKGWLSDKSTVDQICFGVEIVSTDDAEARFEVTAFSISEKLKRNADGAPPAGGDAKR